MKLMMVLGSTRQGRKGEVVGNWLHGQAESDNRFEIDYVDLRAVNLPFLDEPTTPFDMKSLDEYNRPEAKTWAQRVEASQGFVFITPEYNHGYSAVLKNALDSVGHPWVDKPAGLVSYGGISGGARAVEQLRLVTIELGLVPVATPLHFPYFERAFDEHGQPERLDYYTANFQKMRDEILRLQTVFTKS